MAKNVINEGNMVTLRINTLFYPKDHIEASIEAFINIAGFSKKDDTLIIMPKDNSHASIIGYEFFNYMLGLKK